MTDFLAALRADGTALGTAAAADWAAPVPQCGDWTARDLVRHVGRLHHGIAALVRQRATAMPEGWGRDAWPEPPDDDAGRAAWFAEGVTGLVEALSATDPGTPVWNWSSAPDTAAFWRRRMAQETAVHRWDAESATGTAGPIAGDLADDGVAEVFELMLPRLQSRRPAEGLTGTLALTATDTGRRWLARLGPASVELTVDADEVRAEEADASVSGTSSDVLLALWNRVSWDDLRVDDRTGLLARWRAVVHL